MSVEGDYDLAYFARSMRGSDRFALVGMSLVAAFFVFLGVLSAVAPTNPNTPVSFRVFVLVGFCLGGLLFVLLGLRLRYKDIPTRLQLTPEGLVFEFRDGSRLARSWSDPRLALRIQDYDIDSSGNRGPLLTATSWDLWLTTPDAGRDRGGPIPGRAAADILEVARLRNLPVSEVRRSEWQGEVSRRFVEIRIGGGPATARNP